MKTELISIVFLGLAFSISGQQGNPEGITSGKITYEEKIKLEIRLEGDAAQFEGMLPKERKSEKILSFNSQSTLFEEGADIEEEMATDNAEGGIRIRMMGSGENKIFTDLKKKRVIDQRDFMNRIFLVEKEMPATGWKITGNQKSVLGYNCMEAITQDTAGNKTIAWFTPAIKVQGGPAGLCDLPGMILEADIDGGSRTYLATSVEPVNAGDLKIEKPKDGKLVSEDEYKDIVDAKMKEMGVEQGTGSKSHMQIVIKR